jgi:hypothetical protein
VKIDKAMRRERDQARRKKPSTGYTDSNRKDKINSKRKRDSIKHKEDERYSSEI